MAEEHPKIYMISKLVGDVEAEAFAGPRSGVTITYEPAPYGEYGTTFQFRYQATARSQHDLVRAIEMTIWNLETMRRDALKTSDEDFNA